MKKCPVCGVEHSDIVPVCSICGSPLNNVPQTPGSTPSDGVTLKEPASPAETAPKAEPETAPAPDFSTADIQAAVSSVVNFAVEHDKTKDDPFKDSEPFDEDSPFVVNAMREPGTKAPSAGKQEPAAKNAPSPAAREVKAPSKADTPKKSFYSKKVSSSAKEAPASKSSSKKAQPTPKQPEPAKSASQAIDTTAVAAASAQKVQAAKQNAMAAKARNAQAAEEESSKDFDWSERRHKRNQPKTNTPVIAAVCALLALLIIAMVVLLGKMIAGNGNDNQQDGDQQPGVVDNDNPDGEQGDTQGQDNQDDATLPEADPNAEDNTGNPDDAQEPQDGEADAENPDADTPDDTTDPETNTNEGDSQNGDGAQSGDDTQNGDNAQAGTGSEENEGGQTVTPPAELPAITETDETVYATAAVNVRDYPSTQNSNVINVLSAGQSVTRTGKTSTGWSRVDLGGGIVGYVSSSYLSTTKNSGGSDNSSDSSDTAYTTADVNVRDNPNGTVIATLSKGQQVTLTGKTSGNWTQVKTGSVTGYVYSSYLSKTKGGSSDSGDSKDDVDVTKTDETVYATTGVNVRDYPSSSTGKVIATLSKGQKVTRTGKTSNGWSQIKINGTTGYVYSSYLSTSKDGSGDSGNSGDSGSATNSGYILSKSDSKYYTKDELSTLSKSQLRLARNEIYARHGRKFNDSSIQEYFNNCTWYSGTIDPATFDANINSYLNDYEIANLKVIQSLES